MKLINAIFTLSIQTDMQNIVSDQDLQSFPLIQQFWDTATGYKMERWQFWTNMVKW